MFAGFSISLATFFRFSPMRKKSSILFIHIIYYLMVLIISCELILYGAIKASGASQGVFAASVIFLISSCIVAGIGEFFIIGDEKR